MTEAGPRLLADTHVVLWYATDDPRLTAAAAQALEADAGETFVSAASLWEIAIKRSLGKLEAPEDLPVRLTDELGFVPLAVTGEHAWAVRNLPRLHGDPFDRLLVAQAQVERLTIVSADASLAEYEVPVLWR